MDSDVTASFEDPAAAEDVAAALAQAGLGQDELLVFPAESDEALRAIRAASPNHVARAIVAPEVGSAIGFTLGFLGGGFFGLLLGSGVLVMMGREPAMAIGPFWSAVVGGLTLGVAGALAGYIFNAPLPKLDPAPERRPEPRLTVVSVTLPDDEAASVAETVAAKGPRRLGVWRRTADGWLPR